MKPFVKKSLAHILRVESELVLWKYRPKIIAITGSLGKTSTKDAVFAVLSDVAYVRKSEKSYNSELGLPLTVLGLPNGWNNPLAWILNIWKGLWLFIWPHKYPAWLVLEVGVGKPGDMKKTAMWLKTDAVIITAISDTPAHIEFFSSRKHLIEEKSGLIKTLKKDGLLVLNADDESVLEMRHKTKNRLVTYGFNPEADVVASQYNIAYNALGKPEGIVYRVDKSGASLPVSIEGVFGRNHLYASLASLAVSYGLDFNVISAIESLKSYDVPPGRMRMLSGINNCEIIDDSYNSSPFATASALQTLSEINATRKIAVLGDMLELGKHTIQAHHDIGVMVAGIANVLVVVGPRSLDIKSGAISLGMAEENIFEFQTSILAGDFMQEFVQPGDLILVKGSQGMRMERVVEKILEDQKNRDTLLVRQDAEWQKKK